MKHRLLILGTLPTAIAATSDHQQLETEIVTLDKRPQLPEIVLQEEADIKPDRREERDEWRRRNRMYNQRLQSRGRR